MSTRFRLQYGIVQLFAVALLAAGFAQAFSQLAPWVAIAATMSGVCGAVVLLQVLRHVRSLVSGVILVAASSVSSQAGGYYFADATASDHLSMVIAGAATGSAIWLFCILHRASGHSSIIPAARRPQLYFAIGILAFIVGPALSLAFYGVASLFYPPHPLDVSHDIRAHLVIGAIAGGLGAFGYLLAGIVRLGSARQGFGAETESDTIAPKKQGASEHTTD